MNDPKSEKPTELAIDLEQWKRDIQTFAETTSQALNAIAAELSSGCSNGRPRGTVHYDTRMVNSDTRAELAAYESKDSLGDQRLAKLKSQLEKRISSTS